jgi:hypothetical protein
MRSHALGSAAEGASEHVDGLQELFPERIVSPEAAHARESLGLGCHRVGAADTDHPRLGRTELESLVAEAVKLVVEAGRLV